MSLKTSSSNLRSAPADTEATSPAAPHAQQISNYQPSVQMQKAARSTRKEASSVPRTRVGLVSLNTFVKPKTRANFKHVAALCGMTSQDLINALVELVVVEYHEDQKQLKEALTEITKRHSKPIATVLDRAVKKSLQRTSSPR